MDVNDLTAGQEVIHKRSRRVGTILNVEGPVNILIGGDFPDRDYVSYFTYRDLALYPLWPEKGSRITDDYSPFYRIDTY